MRKLTDARAISILKKHATTASSLKKIVSHSKAVRKLALHIAASIKHKRINTCFLSTASLLHDIGRFVCPPGDESSIWHGVVGAGILRKEDLPKHALVAERHIGSGITKAEAKKLGLPDKSYLPKTIEEKIICYADSRIFGTKKVALKRVLERYRREVGEALVKRTIILHKAIESLQQ